MMGVKRGISAMDMGRSGYLRIRRIWSRTSLVIPRIMHDLIEQAEIFECNLIPHQECTIRKINEANAEGRLFLNQRMQIQHCYWPIPDPVTSRNFGDTEKPLYTSDTLNDASSFVLSNCIIMDSSSRR